ncbi:hypothetical protein AMTRI_Chr03g52060 [Amborella trichopoda]
MDARLKYQQPDKDPGSQVTSTTTPHSHRWGWWLVVGLYACSLLFGQAVATLLSRLYFEKGGNSKWLATLVQSVAFPLLFPFLLFYLPKHHHPSSSSDQNGDNSSTGSSHTLALAYVALGLLIIGDNMLYTWGVALLPVSTYSLICASQLGFNALFSFLLNKQPLKPLTINSVVLLTFSSALLAIQSPSDRPPGLSRIKYALGFICTVAASALYALILSLMQKVSTRWRCQNISGILRMQVWTSAVATLVCVIGIFWSGEWRKLRKEASGFTAGGAAGYTQVVVWMAVGWQICSVGVVGLVFVVSSLFSNVVSTLSLPLVPIVAVFLFRDKMDGVKVAALLLALWGFGSYGYQQYLDEGAERRKMRRVVETEGGLVQNGGDERGW